jgi:hypothetical protein
LANKSQEQITEEYRVKVSEVEMLTEKIMNLIEKINV